MANQNRRHTAPAAVAPESTVPAPVAPFMSEGTRQDLEIHGRAMEPMSGAVFVRDPDSGEVTVVARENAGN